MMWQRFLDVLLWPGRRVVSLFPRLGTEERRLLHNITNYVVWLSLFCGLLIWLVIRYSPI